MLNCIFVLKKSKFGLTTLSYTNTRLKHSE